MTTTELHHKLTEIERHLAHASRGDQQRAAARLRQILAVSERPQRRERASRGEDRSVDLFDNVPV